MSNVPPSDRAMANWISSGIIGPQSLDHMIKPCPGCGAQFILKDPHVQVVNEMAENRGHGRGELLTYCMICSHYIDQILRQFNKGDPVDNRKFIDKIIQLMY